MVLQRDIPIQRAQRDPLPIFVLGCHRDIDLSVRCLASIGSRLKQPFSVTVLSDGSLTSDDSARLQGSLPSLTIIKREDLDTRVIQALKDFPLCRKYREWCPWALKLIDIPLCAQSDYVYVDSDILFMRDFTLLTTDVNLVSMHSYANIYSFGFTDRLAPVGQIPIVDRLNSGFLLVNKVAFSLELIERFLHSTGKHRRPFLSEQTAWAVLAAHTSSGHFNSRQIAFPHTALDAQQRFKWRPVAMHFIGGTRHLIPDVRRAAAEWPEDERPIDLTISPTRQLTRTGFFIDLCRHRLLIRRCRRTGVVK